MYVRLHNSKAACPNFTKFSVHVNCGHSRSFSNDSAIHYVLLVLQMTSCLPIIGLAKATPVGHILSDSPGAETGRSLMSTIALF